MTADAALRFSELTVLGYVIAILSYFLLPAAAFCLLRKYRAGSIVAVIIGAVIYLLVTRLNDIGVQLLFRGQPHADLMVLAAETVCYWEELGRWLAMRYPVTGIRSPGAAVSYGIGHAGMEMILRGAQKCSILGMGLRLNREGITAFTAGLDTDRAASVIAQLADYAAHHLLCGVLDSLEAAVLFCVHIALSLLIYCGIRTETSRKTLPAAMGLHLLVNLCGWLVSFSGSDALRSLAGICVGAVVIWIAMKLADGWEMLDEIRYPMETE